MNYCLDARTATTHFPGIGRYAVNLARAMRSLLTPDERLTLLHNPAAASPWRIEGITDTNVELIAVPRSPFSLAQQWEVPARLRRLHATLYHSTYYLMPYRPGVPTMLTFYDLIPLRYPHYFSRVQRLIFAITIRLAVHTSDALITISQATSKDLTRFLGVPPAAIHTIPLAADPIFAPQPAEAIRHLRQKYSLPEDYVLYFGSNKPHKNLVRLIHAWDALQSRTLPLVIAGVWDERYPEPKRLHEVLAPGDTVRFLGPVEETEAPLLYAGATVFVFPSEYEGFGLPVLEAMACGTPVACANSASLPEVVGDAALLFNPGEVEAIADALQRLLDDAGLRADLRDRGRRRAAEFSWRRTAGATLSLYRRVAQDTEPQRPGKP